MFSSVSQDDQVNQVEQLIQAMDAMLVPIVIGLAFSFCLEQFHSPRPQPVWRRHPVALLLHLGLWLILFLIEFLQFRRPWLALCLSSTIFYVLVLINHAKFRSLREPFIYQDFEYFLDAIRHPRLYLPFFGFWKIALCLAAVGAALWVGVTVETPLTASSPTGLVWTAYFCLLLLSIALLLIGNLYKPELSFKPTQDFHKYGLLAMLWRYAKAERKSFAPLALAKYSSLTQAAINDNADFSFIHQDNPFVHDSLLPDTIVVQSESFFDPRRVFSNIDPMVLNAFDQACQTSIKFGTLTVPAWGANTVRTEFEFLTGIDTAQLGVDQFNPYRRCVQYGLPSIAHEFKKRGYRTICVHPYPASFYQRDNIFPLLGFDVFIDIKSFNSTKDSSEQCPYISDELLTNKVLELLDRPSTQPLFIFVITMENHGPLHLETISPAESEQWVKELLPPGCKDLLVYLRHLANADQMIRRLIERLSLSSQATATQGLTAELCSAQGVAPPRPGQLLWYGDHVPVLPAVYDRLGMPDGQTDFFLWRSHDAGKLSLLNPQQSLSPQTNKTLHTNNSPYSNKSPRTLGAHQLAVELLK